MDFRGLPGQAGNGQCCQPCETSLRDIAFAGGPALSARAQAQQLDKVTFATNWVAQAEHGGFYQALVDGTYRKHGLDVTILPGGPNVNHRLQLLAGRIEFYMSANTLQAFDAVGAEHPDAGRRRDVPEGPAGAAGASRTRASRNSRT